MRIGFLLIIGLLAGFSVLAAPPRTSTGAAKAPAGMPKFSKEEEIWIRDSLSQDTVTAYLADCAEQLVQGSKGEPLPPSQIRFYAAKVRRWEKYYFFEHDTKISRPWLGNVIKFFDALAAAREKIVDLRIQKKTETEEFRKWQDYYQKTAATFRDAVRKPIIVTDKEKLSDLGRQKKAVVEELFPDLTKSKPKQEPKK